MTLLVAAVLVAALNGRVAPSAAAAGTVPETTTRPNKPAARTLTVLLVVPQSGPGLDAGNAVRNAVTLALAHARADLRVPASVELKIRVIDEAVRSGPAGATGRRLRDAGIIAVIGSLFPRTYAGIRDVSVKAGAAFLSIGSDDGTTQTAPAATSSSSVPVGVGAAVDTPVLHVLAAESQMAEWAARQLLTETGPIVLVHDGSAEGRSAIAIVDAALRAGDPSKALPVLPLASTVGLIDAKAVAAIMDQRPALIAVGAATAVAARVSAAAHAIDANVRVVAIGQPDGTSCVDAAERFADGDLCVVGGTPLSPVTRARAFREDALAAGLGVPTASATAAYDATMLVVDAVRASLPAGPIDKVDVRAAVASAVRLETSLDGASGTVRFGADGRRVDPPMSLVRRVRGGWAVVRATA